MTIFYTAPTAIRTCMKWGAELPAGHDLTSLRLLGSVGEPINPKAWLWYHKVIGGERCPIVDTWWQTETGQIMISPLPGITSTKPGSATRPLPGIEADVFDESGEPVSGEPTACWSCAAPGRGCSGPSTAKTSDSSIPTSRPSGRRPIAAATPPAATRTATSGCSAGSTT